MITDSLALWLGSAPKGRGHPMIETSHTVSLSDGCQLAVRTSGSGADVVLLLHGGPGWPDYLGSLVKRLAGTRRVVRFDQRGCGASSQTHPWTLDRYLADLRELRREVGVERWHVVGHSWGANYGLLHALDTPEAVRSFVYLSGNGLVWRDWYDRYAVEVQRRLTADEQRRLVELRAIEHRSVDEETEHLRLVLRTDCGDPDRHAEAISQMARRIAGVGINYELNRQLNTELEDLDRDRLRRRCRGLDTPGLFIHGGDDPRPVGAVAAVADWLPNVRLDVIDGVGHNLQMEAPDRACSLIAEHLRSDQSG